MARSLLFPEFKIVRDENRCISCQVCVRQCANDVHAFDSEDNTILSDETNCVGCQRCVTLCPTRALEVIRREPGFRANSN
ncbi:MAG: 4Fe-4S binding protein, partial [Candidatus Caldatribacterium sp.]|nr:4Fe-4S binding protein [Candidatus Caldatribacterium sp.]